MQLNYFSLLSMLLMLVTSGFSVAFHPTHKIADEDIAVNLESMIPKSFDDWKTPEQATAYIINPMTKDSLAKIYSQTLSRTYVNNKGDTVMLSIAYGEDQSDAKSLHYPEICYPAQGFQVVSNQHGLLQTSFGSIRVKRLQAVMGNRIEPITYWTTVGNKVVYAGKETKLEQLRYGFNGYIPDGLLFRVSSVSNDPVESYAIQAAFVNALVPNLQKSARLRLTGL